MAPANGTNGIKTTNRNISTRVVPAIPLPMIRRKAPAPIASSDEKKATAAAAVPAAVPAPAPAPTHAPAPSVSSASPHSVEKPTPPSSSPSPSSRLDQKPVELEASPPSTRTMMAHPAAPNGVSQQDVAGMDALISATAGVRIGELPADDAIDDFSADMLSPISAQLPLSVAATSYQTLSEFPSSISTNAAPAPIRLPPQAYNERVAVHHPQPSNGSLRFGGDLASNKSSPAPVPPLGPSGFTVPNAHSHMQFVPPHALDDYGPPIKFTEGYPPPRMQNYGPSTPHSFHGSQSSAVQDDPFTQHALASGGRKGHEPPAYPPAAAPFQNLPPTPHGGGPHPFEVQSREELIRNVQRGFGDAEFADCQVDLHYVAGPQSADGQSSPDNQTPSPHRTHLSISAHRVILAQSPFLKMLMRHNRTNGISSGSLHVRVDDPNLRSDAFWYAIQSLYGLPVREVHTDPTNVEGVVDQFNFSLGYAAAGHLLQLPAVVYKGIRDAVDLIRWETLETALSFALDGVIMAPSGMAPVSPVPTRAYKYGPVVQDLVQSVLMFIVDNFPIGLQLDQRDPEPTKLRRLPIELHSIRARDSPMVVYGSKFPRHNAQPNGPANAKNPRLSQIKFGDLSPNSNGRPRLPSFGSLGPESPVDPAFAILSRVLLNLPFDFLKFVLEHSGLGNTGWAAQDHRNRIRGWMTTQDRHKVISDVVSERESRRMAVAKAVHDGDVPISEHIRERLYSPAEPGSTAYDARWNELGWKEFAAVHNQGQNDEVPYVTRMWTPLGTDRTLGKF